MPDEERVPGGGQINLAAGTPSVSLGVTRGFVGLLDVLGFSNLVSGDAAGTHLHQYITSLQEALTVPGPGPAVQYVVFSDTIVLTTDDDELTSFQALVLRCSRVLGLMLEREVAIRGAISHGSYVRSALAGGVFVAGTAIIDAYRFEKQQDWVGIMIAPSALRRVPDLNARCTLQGIEISTVAGLRAIRQRSAWAAFVQPCHQIPFHKQNPLDDNDFDGFAVVPSTGDVVPAALRDSLARSLTALEWLKSVAPEPAAQAKYKSSHKWLRPIAYQWHEIANWNERLRTELEHEQ